MSCSNCDGQLLSLPREIAEELSKILGPGRRRDNRRVNQYGGKGIIQYSAPATPNGIGQSFTPVDWQSADGMPHPMTIEFGRVASGAGGTFPQGVQSAADGGLALSYRGFARVIISTPAVTQDWFDVDIGRGQKFSTSASRVSVTLQMEAPQSVKYQPGSLAVYGSIGYGTALSVSPLLRTVYIDGLDTPDGITPGRQTIVVPPRANFLQPVQCSSVVNTVQLNFEDNSGTVMYSLQFSPGSQVAPVPITHDVYKIRVSNLDLTAPVNYRLPFQLSA